MPLCVTAARFNMEADILRQERDPGPGGSEVIRQDPDTGEIIREWQPNESDSQTYNTESGLTSFPCIARAIVDGGIRVAGTTERFGDMYEGVDYVRITFPASVRLTRRDRVTNIRDQKGNIIWMEEEQLVPKPTVFGVTGVAPIVDPFGKHIENMALLERAETQ